MYSLTTILQQYLLITSMTRMSPRTVIPHRTTTAIGLLTAIDISFLHVP